jgi:AcrR family transcriptional regulator
MAPSKRDALVDTAMRLFCREGFHATGIDRILSESGVAKMTLYKHFRSKDELILAALRRRDEMVRNRIMRDVEAQTDDPAGRILAHCDVLEKLIAEQEGHGCMFINAAAEYAGKNESIHRAASDHKRMRMEYLASLAKQAGASEPEMLAREIALVLEGAVVLAHVCEDCRAMDSARAGLRALLKAHGIAQPADVAAS